MTFDVRAAAVGDLERELQATRTTLERIPEEHFGWRPHERSWTLAELAGHIANLPEWGAMILRQDGFDLAAGEEQPHPEPPTTRDEVVETWDDNAETLQGAVGQVDADALGATWSLRNGDEVVSAMPRAMALRMWMISHLVHHRAQLGVYLRLLNVPVPATYGPSADEEG